MFKKRLITVLWCVWFCCVMVFGITISLNIARLVIVNSTSGPAINDGVAYHLKADGWQEIRGVNNFDFISRDGVRKKAIGFVCEAYGLSDDETAILEEIPIFLGKNTGNKAGEAVSVNEEPYGIIFRNTLSLNSESSRSVHYIHEYIHVVHALRGGWSAESWKEEGRTVLETAKIMREHYASLEDLSLLEISRLWYGEDGKYHIYATTVLEEGLFCE